MFLNQEKHVGRLRGVKKLTKSKRRKEREGWGERLPRYPYKKEVTTPNTAGHNYIHSRPLPRPLPRREGEWSPRYPYKKDIGFALSLISIYDSFNALWYLYARGVLWVRNVRKEVLLNLWVLWEKEISFVKDKTPHTTPNVLFLTEEHRWTEHTNAHRDIKSTDFTEPYNQR